ncbi:MAG: sigma-54-dependent Fis family transcriptional regulator [candidate division Zixibacteria bacterium]|nr:sigma-54-dependent Fis family transcriptional regulator [candidate division Zixibacteria bacterium]
MEISILLADDDAALRKVISYKLKRKGFEVVAVENGLEAMALLDTRKFDLVLSDMRMPKMGGLELLEAAKRKRPELEVILMTAFADVSQAVKAVKLGAFDYLTKPFEDDQLFMAINKALKFRRLEDENKQLREQLDSRRSTPNVIGISKPIKQILALVDKIAPTDATVLLSGESGSGKEVIARLIHEKSYRRDKSFVAVNCAAIPRELIESELFGHVKGAFTGAVRDKRGKFELAEGGTLLLDEIGQLGIELQAKLLRVIQERVIEPVGSERQIEIDVRLLAATNENLKERIAQGSFREDLFYRLNVIPLTVPTLRERRDDIPLLVREFLARFSPGATITVDQALEQKLISLPWPGNIRELENLVERMVVLRRSDTLTLEDLPAEYLTASAMVSSSEHSGDIGFHEAEHQLVLAALEKNNWNKSKAAAQLKIPRHILIYRMKKYNIRPSDE